MVKNIRVLYLNLGNVTTWNAEEILDLSYCTYVGEIDLENEDSELFLEKVGQLTDKWDIILINDDASDLKNTLSNIFTLMKIDLKRVFFISDISNWPFEKRETFRKLFNVYSTFYRHINYWLYAVEKKYITTCVEGLTFVSDTRDIVIPVFMNTKNMVWSRNEMIVLSKLAKKYYDLEVASEGFLLDIGANIGTTCVYLKSKIYKNMKCYAFEPMLNIREILKWNTELNGEKEIEVLGYALSNESTSYDMELNDGNFGGSHIQECETGISEKVLSITLDEFVDSYGIDTKKPIVMWIDTEGFEDKVFYGAKNVLKNRPIVYFEYNPGMYGDNGRKLIAFLKNYYSSYICMRDYFDGNKEARRIDDLIAYGDFLALDGDQDDIFLVP